MSSDWKGLFSDDGLAPSAQGASSVGLGGTGWYGKLPAIGDFASRRLDDSFVRVWDDWLQRAVTASKSALHETWLDVYLSSPIWNFAIFPNVLHADNAYAGCLMSSADRVGRYFPLTTCIEVSYPQVLADELASGTPWYRGLNDIMVSALDPNTSVEEFDTRLTAHSLNDSGLATDGGYGMAPALVAASGSSPAGGVAAELSRLLPATQRAFLLQALNGKCLWWANIATADGGSTTIYWVQKGMLSPQHYTRLISSEAPSTY